MKTKITLIGALLFALQFIGTQTSFAQVKVVSGNSVGIGTETPHASAKLEINSNSKGLLVPRMSDADRQAIANPADGLIVYVMESSPALRGLYYCDGGGSTNWRKIDNTSDLGFTVVDTDHIDLTLTNSQLSAMLIPTGVTPGPYTSANITVDATGRITSASNGGSGGVGLLKSATAKGNTTGFSATSIVSSTGTTGAHTVVGSVSFSPTKINSKLLITAKAVFRKSANTTSTTLDTRITRNLPTTNTILNNFTPLTSNVASFVFAPVVFTFTDQLNLTTLAPVTYNFDARSSAATTIFPGTWEITIVELDVPQGPQGPQGIQGIQGVPGTNGVGGVTIAGPGIAVNGTGSIGNPYVVSNNFIEQDGSPTNELQTISTNNTPGNLTLSQNGGTLTLNVNDADASPSNEIQNLTLTGATLGISGGNSVTLPSATPTNLTVTGTASPLTLNSSTGSDVNILAGPGIGLSAGTGSITINNTFVEQDASSTNEIQTLSTNALPGNVKLTSGGEININVNDADANPTNEIQSLSLTGNSLSISGGNAVTLPLSDIQVSQNYVAKGGTTLGQLLNSPIQITTDDRVFIGTSGPDLTSKLHIDGKLTLKYPNNLNNIVIGNDAGKGTQTGASNLIIGDYAGKNMTSGSSNVFLGETSGNKNTEGFNNTFVGNTAGYKTTTGNFNTMLGSAAGFHNVTGSYNTYVGAHFGGTCSMGSNNVAVGANAGFNTGGSGNIFIGTNARQYANCAPYNNSIALGDSTRVTASNQVKIGNVLTTSIGGQVGWTTLSDGRFKTNIQPSKFGLDFIKKLRPVDYVVDIAKLKAFQGDTTSSNYQSKNQPVQTGFIAQEVEKAAADLSFEFSGVDKPQNDETAYGIRYSEFVVPLVKAVQEQQSQIEAQDKMIKALMDRLDRQDEMIKQLQVDKK